jgi:hypothetical protein
MARLVRLVCLGVAGGVALYVLLYPPRPEFPPAEDQEVVANFTRSAHLSAAKSGISWRFLWFWVLILGLHSLWCLLSGVVGYCRHGDQLLLFLGAEAGCEAKAESFFFGLATAPAHVEDNLNDSWLEFAESSVMFHREFVSVGLFC